MNKSTKKLILYGAGRIGKKMALHITDENIPIECFCDSDSEKWGKSCSGYPIRCANEIKHLYPEGSYYILLTMLKESATKVKRELIEKNIFSINDFYDEKLDPLGIMRFFITYNKSFIVPQELEQNFRYLNEENERELKKGLLFHYFNVNSYDDLASDDERNAFANHLYRRLESHRKSVIPWLNSICKLKNASVLEIGCGAGPSTVALCEQGAKVTAIDVGEDGIEVAKIRLKLYGLTANFMIMNAANILEELLGKRFDFIIFFASLEHMTFEERIQSLKSAFKMLNPNGHVVLIETPNRLWHVDEHTSFEPFYHWLPDILAKEYSKFTHREGFNNGFDSTNEDDDVRFARWGRGVSYHELEVALGGRSRVQVVSSLNSFWGVPESAYKSMLKKVGPEGIHGGFYEPNLDIALRNPDYNKKSEAK